MIENCGWFQVYFGVPDCVSNLVKEHNSSVIIFTRFVFHSPATCLPYSPLAISCALMLSNKAYTCFVVVVSK